MEMEEYKFATVILVCVMTLIAILWILDSKRLSKRLKISNKLNESQLEDLKGLRMEVVSYKDRFDKSLNSLKTEVIQSFKELKTEKPEKVVNGMIIDEDNMSLKHMYDLYEPYHDPKLIYKSVKKYYPVVDTKLRKWVVRGDSIYNLNGFMFEIKSEAQEYVDKLNKDK